MYESLLLLLLNGGLDLLWQLGQLLVKLEIQSIFRSSHSRVNLKEKMYILLKNTQFNYSFTNNPLKWNFHLQYIILGETNVNSLVVFHYFITYDRKNNNDKIKKIPRLYKVVMAKGKYFKCAFRREYSYKTSV